MPNKQIMVTMRRIFSYIFIVVVGLGFLAMVSYLYKIVSSKSASPELSDQQRTFANAQPTATPLQPTATPVIRDYKTILLLERATDLMVNYIEKVRAGEIDPSDTSIRDSYINAFPVAIDAYNHSTPINGMEHGWKNVMMVAQAYTLVYPLLQQGKMVSDNDILNMKYSRQWLTNYQTTEESVLSSRGVGADYFTAEAQAVEVILQENYGNIPVPTAGP